MTQQERPRLPQVEPHEARREAEDLLGSEANDRGVYRAIAWGLVAVAGELAAIRRKLK
ncbi:hypothetical protein OG279_26290 [Streptomyces sp. NBC_01201]|uniref:hypothetical protein n=1 Tax=unclassified Streptomyces TaxID=2593676 RepID=UPI002E0D7230|nr:hypothetical protein OG725_24540 [Streptomyces sp. NBC_01213]WSQ82797.1 hypothetical protein OG725_37485 [Streptomyces sp. NBC_01213]WSR50930.1 hypothetical protein OG279_26290 [Streptomyces sp. NBC_01201]